MNKPPVIIFDGICNLCCGWVQFLIRRDKNARFRFASLQSQTGESILNSFNLSNKIKTIVYLKDNQCFQESSAVLEILKDLGDAWKVFILLKLIPRTIRDTIYRLIARNRYILFGKRATCFLPTWDNQKRFLS